MEVVEIKVKEKDFFSIHSNDQKKSLVYETATKLCEHKDVEYSSLSNEKKFKLLKKMFTSCEMCQLRYSSNNPILACGNIYDPKAIFIGRNPRNIDTEKGGIYKGLYGHILNKYVSYLGLSFKEVYLTYVVKCSTRNNRPISKEEVLDCSFWLDIELSDLVNMPKLIFLLGYDALQVFTGYSPNNMNSVYGNIYSSNGTYYIPLHSPAQFYMDNTCRENAVSILKYVKNSILPIVEGE
jgi:uracil-DNA glycosylase family 4